MLRITACDVSFGHHNHTCSSTDSFSARKQPKLMIRKAANYYSQELCDDISRKPQKRRWRISRKLSLKILSSPQTKGSETRSPRGLKSAGWRARRQKRDGHEPSFTDLLSLSHLNDSDLISKINSTVEIWSHGKRETRIPKLVEGSIHTKVGSLPLLRGTSYGRLHWTAQII